MPIPVSMRSGPKTAFAEIERKWEYRTRRAIDKITRGTVLAFDIDEARQKVRALHPDQPIISIALFRTTTEIKRDRRKAIAAFKKGMTI